MFRSQLIHAIAIAIAFGAAASAGAAEPLRQAGPPHRPAAWAERHGTAPVLLAAIHHDVMDEAHYVADPPGHSVWRATTEGDCKDLALEMGRRLHQAGIPSRAMHILVTWKPSYHQWHAALLVRIGGAAWVLDSLRPSPVRWDGKGVEFQVGPLGRRVVAVNGIAVTPTPWRR